MGRWEPNARMRLVRAAIDLVAEQEYDATTTTQIAERAGLTRATFFRHFPDKREVFFAGQEQHAALLAAGIAAAPATATPLEAVGAGLAALTATFTPEQHEWGSRLLATVAATVELQERDALKTLALTVAMTTALVARDTPELTARIAADLGAIALKRGFARWSTEERADNEQFALLTRAALADLRTAATTLT